MCIAVPVTILNVENGKALAKAAGGRLNIDTRLTPRIKAGDKALVHAGCAIAVIDEEEARKIEETIKEISEELFI